MSLPANGIAPGQALRHNPRAMRPLLLLLCLLLPACGTIHNLGQKARAKQREKELKKLSEASISEASGRLGEKAAGEVILVNADSGFVLIRARNGLTLQTDEELQCQGSGTARLRVTPENRKSHNLFAANIVSGTPQKGDSVIPVKGTGKPQPKLVPIAASPLTGSSAPAGTISVDPNSIRPESLPRSTLDEPDNSVPPMTRPDPRRDPGNLLVEPPLPEDAEKPLLPEPALPQ